MADVNLVVPDCYHLVDTATEMTLVQWQKTLTVADSYNLHYSNRINSTSGTTIVLNTIDLDLDDCFHDHPIYVCEPFTSVYVLDVDDATHHHQGGYFELNFEAEVDGNLPALDCSAAMGHRGSLSKPLADMEASGTSGAYFAWKTGTIGIEATAIGGGYGNLEKKIPTLRREDARFASRAGPLSLPPMEISLTISGERLAWGSATMPGLELDADATTPIVCSLSKTIGFLSLDADGSTIATGSFDKKISGLKITSVSAGGNCNLDAVMPPILADGEGTLHDVLTLTVDLPTIIIGGIGSGFKGGGARISVLQNRTRFEDYELQHVR